MLRTIDGFALSIDCAALLDDRSLAPPSIAQQSTDGVY